jgi:hypothetical protein
LALPVAIAALAVLGCGGDDDDDGGDGGEPAPKLKATSSGIEGVPIPSTAKPYEVGDIWLVPGSTYDEVLAFYEEQMPEGQDFNGWPWCDTGGDGDIHAHIYARGAKDILNVTVSDDPEDKQPPNILIGVDKSGPC